MDGYWESGYGLSNNTKLSPPTRTRSLENMTKKAKNALHFPLATDETLLWSFWVNNFQWQSRSNIRLGDICETNFQNRSIIAYLQLLQFTRSNDTNALNSVVTGCKSNVCLCKLSLDFLLLSVISSDVTGFNLLSFWIWVSNWRFHFLVNWFTAISD